MSTIGQKRRRSSDVVMEIDPTLDLFGRMPCGQHGAVRMLCVRCQEAQTQFLPNQDYAYLRMTVDGSSLSFCVCDGVGSSYKGDFAAKYLARHLTEWLHGLKSIGTQEANSLNGEPLYSQLIAQLTAWVHKGQSELRTVAMPEQTNALVREVLEETRENYGSEVVFVAGRVDLLAAPENPARLPRAHLLLCWMGNVTPYLFAQEAANITLGYRADDAVRWSTARGLRGTPTMRTMTLDALHRLVVHTDGLDRIGPQVVSMNDEDLQRAVYDLLAHPSNDDMTLLDIFWHDGNSSRPIVLA